MKYLPEFHNNQDMFTIHVNVLLTKEIYVSYHLQRGRRRRQKWQTPPEWIQKILRIRGVKEFSVASYHVRVEKFPLFDFRQIAPKVLAILLAHIDPKGKGHDLSNGLIPTIAERRKPKGTLLRLERARNAS